MKGDVPTPYFPTTFTEQSSTATISCDTVGRYFAANKMVLSRHDACPPGFIRSYMRGTALTLTSQLGCILSRAPLTRLPVACEKTPSYGSRTTIPGTYRRRYIHRYIHTYMVRSGLAPARKGTKGMLRSSARVHAAAALLWSGLYQTHSLPLIGAAVLGIPSHCAPEQANICIISILHDLVADMTRHPRELAFAYPS